ncbi:TIR domain-containing protein [Lentzea sp. NPDC060358]|uniref:TIR domain-containing protein n=1 Tax=Lentzea sp. NPDC060358 TaxID=3347103 RepID=UPI00364DD9A1
MEYFHARLSTVGARHDEVKLDMSLPELEEKILAPYREGRIITMNGRSIDPMEIERLRISMSDVPSRVLIQEIEHGRRNSSVAVIGGPSMGWRAANRADDVTDEYVIGPPGGLPSSGDAKLNSGERDKLEVNASGRRGNSIFLVHGRDLAIVVAMKQFLRSLGINVVEWNHAVAQTGTPNPYVGDVVMQGLKMSDAAVILFTPDELVRLRDDLVSDSDGVHERELQGQARPNVYYEAGIADAIDRQRTILVDVGPVKPFSDASGRLVVRFDGSASKRNNLAERLRLAGLEVNTSGDDWLSDGDFESAIKASVAVLDNALKRGKGK